MPFERFVPLPTVSTLRPSKVIEDIPKWVEVEAPETDSDVFVEKGQRDKSFLKKILFLIKN